MRTLTDAEQVQRYEKVLRYVEGRVDDIRAEIDHHRYGGREWHVYGRRGAPGRRGSCGPDSHEQYLTAAGWVDAIGLEIIVYKELRTRLNVLKAAENASDLSIEASLNSILKDCGIQTTVELINGLHGDR